MIARKQTSSILSIVLIIGALTMLPGCFYGNPYDHVQWSSPEASYPLVRIDDYTRSDGELVPWRIVSIDTNHRTHWLVVELAAAGDPSQYNFHLALSLLSANFSTDFLNDKDKSQPPIKLFSKNPHWIVGAALDYGVLAGYGLRSYPQYRLNDSDEYRFCAPLRYSAAIDETIRSMERGNRIVLRVQGGAERFFGEKYEYVHTR